MENKNTSFESSTNLYDMQLYRLKKMIHASRDIRVIAVLAELAMQYMDGEVDIVMVNGEMKFILAKDADALVT